MRVLGIIAEYNPFHKGHQYHLEQAKKATDCDYTVVALSGNFVQRGQPAIFSKNQRAQWALQAGADLVVEIPVLYALQSAEGYAYGAVKLLNSLGIVTHLAFGSESADLETLKAIAKLLIHEPLSFKAALRKALDRGVPYAKALQTAVAETLDEDAARLLGQPNSILSIAYLKAILRLQSWMHPCIIERAGSGYHSLSIDESYPSATAIRHHIQTKGLDDRCQSALPDFVYDSLVQAKAQGAQPVDWSSFDAMLLYALRRLGPDGIRQLPEVDEGLENRFWQAAQSAATVGELCMDVKNKRYPLTRLQRICACALLGITRDMQAPYLPTGKAPQYIRILGMRESAQELLRALRDSAWEDIVYKPARYKPSEPALQTLWQMDQLASDIYALSQTQPDLRRCSIDKVSPFERL